MKKKFLIASLFILLNAVSFAQIDELGKEALKKYQALSQQDYFQHLSIQLLSEIQSLKSQNQKISEDYRKIERHLFNLELMLAYIKFREKIETSNSDTFDQTFYCIFMRDTLGYIIKNNDLINNAVVNIFYKYDYLQHEKLFDFNNKNNAVLFPKTHELFKKNVLKLEFQVSDEPVMLQVTKTPFPTINLMPDNKTTERQKKIAENYMNTILRIKELKIFDFDVIRLYIQIERKEAPNKELPELIKAREKYIVFLKGLYDEKK